MLALGRRRIACLRICPCRLRLAAGPGVSTASSPASFFASRRLGPRPIGASASSAGVMTVAVTDTTPKSAARLHHAPTTSTRTGAWCPRDLAPPCFRQANLRWHDTGRVTVVAVTLCRGRDGSVGAALHATGHRACSNSRLNRMAVVTVVLKIYLGP